MPMIQFLSLFAISGIPGLEGCDTGVVFVLALDNRFALGTVYLGGATLDICRWQMKGRA